MIYEIQALVPTFQVFSSMQSHDLGCSYTGGADPASVLTDAGLSFVSQSQSMWRRSMTKTQIFFITNDLFSKVFITIQTQAPIHLLIPC